jgi:predicted  nucleic acid-binding Zn-ribbon protein
MVRCTKCRFLFEAKTPGLLPACVQCGGATMMIVKIEPSDAPTAMPTMRFAAIKADSVR